MCIALFTIYFQTLTLQSVMTQAPPKNKPKIRLFVPQDFVAGGQLLLEEGQSHYLANVMRCQPGEPIAIFNGREGQWLADVGGVRKKSVTLNVVQQMAPQRNSPDLWLAFAPIKHHMERMVEKAVELGASALLPVVTQHAVVRSVNVDKLMAHAIEAAEQCERHDVPRIAPYKDIGALLSGWPQDRVLLHADETGGGKGLRELLPLLAGKKYGVLVGPEGGFSADERRMIAAFDNAQGFGMGSRILRADTAAIAALACVQCYAGDWDAPPRFEGES